MYCIRKLTRHEWCWLYSADFNNLFKQLTPSSQLTEKHFKEWYIKTLSNPNFHMYGVIDTINDKLIGIGVLLVEEKYYRQINNKRGRAGHIEDIIIDKEHRGKKLGHRLLTYIKEQAVEINCYKIQLHCNKECAPFYSKLGFKSTKTSMEIYLSIE
jgi:glucosamine-phosphate N-acetyltransferase